VSLTFLIRQLRAPSPDVRITHEGIFTSHDSFLITWAEIEELSLATWMGSPYLRIVPRNLEAVAARAKASSRPWRRFAIDATLTFFPSTTSPAPLGLSQRALPISIRDLLMAIDGYPGAVWNPTA